MAETGHSTDRSCWVATAPERGSFEPLSADTAADVAVVGGGIVGLSAAVMLQRSGASVVLLEAARVGEQVTGGSTAKVTSQHGLIYAYLGDTFGREAARVYARSNEAGREWIAAQIGEIGIDCDFAEEAAYTYALTDEHAAAVEREVEAATDAGLPANLERDDVGLPFPVRAAVRFDGQARFHPVRYLAGLAAEFLERGGRIHESTRVVDVDGGRPCTVITERGKLRADQVVIATNIPILDRGGFFGRAFPYRHMCIAAPVDNERVPGGMFISSDQPTRSLRSASWSDTQRMMVFVGEAFPTGHDDPGKRLRDLETFAQEHFGVGPPAYRWGNQDYYSADRIPYVGPILPRVSRIRVATGFNAWGITTGTAAAMILSDGVLGKRNEWAELYDSRRVGWRGGSRTLVQKNLGVARSWTAERLKGAPERDATSLDPGDAGIVRVQGKAAAAYRDPDGVLHAFDARCTHMGCHLHWNRVELSWDCHCHGSRFDTDGNVLHGPAVRPLKALREEA